MIHDNQDKRCGHHDGVESCTLHKDGQERYKIRDMEGCHSCIILRLADLSSHSGEVQKGREDYLNAVKGIWQAVCEVIPTVDIQDISRLGSPEEIHGMEG